MLPQTPSQKKTVRKRAAETEIASPKDRLPMRLTRRSGYAIQAMLQLSDVEGEGRVSSSQIAADGDMPESFLRTILRQLVCGHLLESSRGPDGGYRLSRPAESITLLEVIEAVDGPLVCVWDSPSIAGDDQESVSATKRKLAPGITKTASPANGAACGAGKNGSRKHASARQNARNRRAFDRITRATRDHLSSVTIAGLGEMSAERSMIPFGLIGIGYGPLATHDGDWVI